MDFLQSVLAAVIGTSVQMGAVDYSAERYYQCEELVVAACEARGGCNMTEEARVQHATCPDVWGELVEQKVPGMSTLGSAY